MEVFCHNTPMSKKISWISVAYLILMIYLIGQEAYHFFSPGSRINLYFSLLRAFDLVFYVPYLLTFYQIIFNILSLILLFLYIYEIQFLNKTFWKYFLIFNFLFDLTGHSYHVNELIGISYTNPRMAIIIFLSSAIPYLPKYIACYRYAFYNSASNKARC